MRLSHLHIPNSISYIHSLRLQEALLERHFVYNTARLQSRTDLSTPATSPPPPPTLLTFQTTPTYTVGRRHLKTNPLSDSQINYLTANNLATFYASPRGGLLTYHAPGQLTGYLICNLRHHGITPRCHIRLLEESVIRTAEKYDVRSCITDDPGVWIQNDGKPTDRKMCAIGVHVSRGVTSHGVGFNVFDHEVDEASKEEYKLPQGQDMDSARNPKDGGRRADGYLSWGFSRIVACGLEGKTVTWLTREGANAGTGTAEVADTLAQEMCIGLSEKGKVKMDGVDKIEEGDVLGSRFKTEIENLVKGTEAADIRGGLEDWVGVLKGGKI